MQNSSLLPAPAQDLKTLCLRAIKQRFQLQQLLPGENSGMNIEPNPQRYFQGEAASPARGYIQDKLRVPPVFELVFTHIEPAAIDYRKTYVTAAGSELSVRKAHRLGSITASPTLMEH